MLFHDYLEVLLGSRVKVRVLRTLWRYGGRQFTLREMAGFLNISHMGVRKVLSDLEAMNVITVGTIGKSYTVKLNRESYAADLLEKIFRLENATLNELVRLLSRGLSRPEVVSAAIFGSVAEKRDRPLSDIDLIVITNQRERVEEVISNLQRQVALRFGNALSAHYIKEREFREKKRTPLISRVLEKHVLLCGKPLR